MTCSIERGHTAPKKGSKAFKGPKDGLWRRVAVALEQLLELQVEATVLQPCHRADLELSEAQVQEVRGPGAARTQWIGRIRISRHSVTSLSTTSYAYIIYIYVTYVYMFDVGSQRYEVMLPLAPEAAGEQLLDLRVLCALETQVATAPQLQVEAPG